MSLVDKDTNVLDDKKETVFMTQLSEKKLLTDEKVTTSDEVHKLTEKITKIEQDVKGNGEVHKRTGKITTNEEVEKGTEKLESLKEAVVNIPRKDSDKFEGQSKGYTGWFNIDHYFLRRKFIHLKQTSITSFMKRILKVYTLNHIRRFLYCLILLN